MYVLYADIMGFKERVMRTKHQELEEELEGLKNKFDKWIKPFLDNVETFKVSMFSDSILIVDENTREGFNRISKAGLGLMHVALTASFPLKGAIAKGLFSYKEDKQLFFGRALVDAYLLQEQIHYYGIVAHNSIEKDIEEHAKGWLVKNKKKGDNSYILKGDNPYILSSIPFKSGNISHYHLAYNLMSNTREIGNDVTATHRSIISSLKEIRHTVSGAPRIYVDKTLQVLKDDLLIFNKKKEKQEKQEKKEKQKDKEVVFPLDNTED